MPYHAEHRSVVAISFSGIDGAGKSTQIDALSATLKSMGLRVRIIRFWDDVARLKQLREASGHRIFKGDKGVGSPTAPINRRDKNVQSWPMTGLRLFLYLVDAFSMRHVARRAAQADTDVIIFDRYTWDELANLNLRNPFLRAYVRLIARWVPRPDVSFFLDADPAQARARKPEYPLDFLHKNRAAYLNLVSLVRGITIVPPNPVDEVKADVLRHTRVALSSCTQLPEKSSDSAGETGHSGGKLGASFGTPSQLG